MKIFSVETGQAQFSGNFHRRNRSSPASVRVYDRSPLLGRRPVTAFAIALRRTGGHRLSPVRRSRQNGGRLFRRWSPVRTPKLRPALAALIESWAKILRPAFGKRTAYRKLGKNIRPTFDKLSKLSITNESWMKIFIQLSVTNESLSKAYRKLVESLTKAG